MCGHFIFGILIEILVIIAVLLFIAKVKKDELGKGFKWIGYILLVIGFLTLACTLTRGIMGMTCCRQQCETGAPGCHAGMGHCCGGMNSCGAGSCGAGMKDGCTMGKDGGMMKDGKACCSGEKEGKMGGKCPYDKDGGEKGHMDSTKLK